MSSFTIKIIAILFMIIDHVGFFLFPQAAVLRAIGRLSFPLFAWLIANGARHTRNIDRYLARLLIFAFISQIPFSLAYQSVGLSYTHLNVLFTLFLGLLSIKILVNSSNKPLAAALIAFLALLAQVFNTDYGLMGVLSIVGFYVFFDDIKKTFLWQSLIYVGILFLMIDLGQVVINEVSLTQPLALLSLIFVNSYNGKHGPKAKYLFYIVYPLQFLIFYFLVVSIK